MPKDTPFTGPLAPIAERIEAAALEAAGYQVSELGSGRPLDVNVKSDNSLVMNVDLESQRRILAKLGNDYAVVAEEDESSHALVKNGGTYFLVDPLDGTTSCKRFMGELGGQIGYGPLIGFVQNDRLSAAAFYSVPHRALYTAVIGQGCYVTIRNFDKPDLDSKRVRVVSPPCASLAEAGALFFVGPHGEETRAIQYLKSLNAIENNYRFGGFANDCTRLARGTEQLSIQFSVKPWDFSAVLLASEAGVGVWADPIKRRVPLTEWRIAMNNPTILAHPSISDELFTALSGMPE